MQVPTGYILVRPEAPAEVTDTGIVIPTMGQEAPPRGTVVMRPLVYRIEDPVHPEVGDRVHHRQYAGQSIPLLLPDAPPVWRCRHCDTRDSEFGLPRLCPRNSDVATGQMGPHEFEPRPPEPATYLVLDLRDIMLVEERTEAPIGHLTLASWPPYQVPTGAP